MWNVIHAAVDCDAKAIAYLEQSHALQPPNNASDRKKNLKIVMRDEDRWIEPAVLPFDFPLEKLEWDPARPFCLIAHLEEGGSKWILLTAGQWRIKDA